jgi:hypothetical protein
MQKASALLKRTFAKSKSLKGDLSTIIQQLLLKRYSAVLFLHILNNLAMQNCDI